MEGGAATLYLAFSTWEGPEDSTADPHSREGGRKEAKVCFLGLKREPKEKTSI